MPQNDKMKKLRLLAQLSQNQLARKANLDRGTVSSAENGKPVQELSRSKIVSALSTELDRDLSEKDVF